MPISVWIRNLTAAWSSFLERLRFNYLPKISDRLLTLSCAQARGRLSIKTPIRVLIDSTIHHHAITHETMWASTGTKLWGGVHPIDTGYMARIPVYRAESEKAAYKNIQFLPGLIQLAKLVYVELMTSAELEAERERQPSSRFRPTGWSDYDLLSGLRIESIDGRACRNFYPGWRDHPSSPQDRQLARLDASDDPIFQGLVSALGKKNSLDAWHIRTAGFHDLPFFLTMDNRLIKTIESQAGHSAIKNLNTKVITPAELGKLLGLTPFPLNLLSYNDASFPVRADMHMPDEQRHRHTKPK